MEPLVGDEAEFEAVVVACVAVEAEGIVGNAVASAAIVEETAARHSRGIEVVGEDPEGKVKDAAISEGVGTWNSPQTKTRARKPPPSKC